MPNWLSLRIWRGHGGERGSSLKARLLWPEAKGDDNVTSNSFAVAIAAFGFCVAFSAPAFAVDKSNDKPVSVRPAKMSPTNLSESECAQLGGKVSTEQIGVCNSHRVCQTKDENGNGHSVCINSR